MASTANLLKCAAKLTSTFLDLLASIVFFFLDFLDAVLCLLFTILDELFEGRAPECYCSGGVERETELIGGGGPEEVSGSLVGRRNIFREKIGGFRKSRKKINGESGNGRSVNSWSDCGCESCVSWLKNGDCNKLHVVSLQIPPVPQEDSNAKPTRNVIFIHGFLGSSSIWNETVFKVLPESENCHYRLFAVDLLGFGRSPKPRESNYTLREHVEMIEKSVIDEHGLDSFHVVAHSMGSIVALALADEHRGAVESVTLVAPVVIVSTTWRLQVLPRIYRGGGRGKRGFSAARAAVNDIYRDIYRAVGRGKHGFLYVVINEPYFYATKDVNGMGVLNDFAGKRLWPPLAFCSAVMSWYEHIGRSACFLFCRNHRTWERIIKLLTRKRDLHFGFIDVTRHTHHSAWHSMHNVICGGAKFTDGYMEALLKAGVKVCVVHGDQDPLVPMDCSSNLKAKFPDVELNIIENGDHASVILGREEEFVQILESVWASSSNVHN